MRDLVQSSYDDCQLPGHPFDSRPAEVRASVLCPDSHEGTRERGIPQRAAFSKQVGQSKQPVTSRRRFRGPLQNLLVAVGAIDLPRPSHNRAARAECAANDPLVFGQRVTEQPLPRINRRLRHNHPGGGAGSH